MAREKEVKLVRHPASGSVNEGENLPEKIVKEREILIQGSTQDENKDLTIYIEEGELIAVEPKEIYKFQLGPGNENLTLQIDKDLLINIQGMLLIFVLGFVMKIIWNFVPI